MAEISQEQRQRLQDIYTEQSYGFTYGCPIIKLSIEDCKRTYFTSDLHLNHANILRFNKRPFKDIADMNISLIQNINDTLSDDSILVSLGDLLFGQYSTYNFFKNKIRASKIYSCIGNHDLRNLEFYRKNWLGENDQKSSRWIWNSSFIVEVFETKDSKGFHNRMLVFECSHHPSYTFTGKFQLHGHLHTPPNIENYTGSDKPIAEELLKRGCYYDCGVDANGYKPVNLVDILTGNTLAPALKDVDFEFWKSKFGMS